MFGRKLKLIFSITILVTLLSALCSIAFAQEVSAPNSSFQIKAYIDSNGNMKADEGEETISRFQYAYVAGVTCSSVDESMQISAIVTRTTPVTLSADQVACVFFLLSSRGGLVSTSNYDAYRTTTTDSGPSSTLWLLEKGKYKISLPIVMRAWSGQR